MEDNNQQNNFNQNLTETNIRLIGDSTVIYNIIELLSYVRHAIKNNMQTEINVKIGKKIANSTLMFDVNGLEIPDLITQNKVEIN